MGVIHMVNIPMKTTGPLNKNSISSLNRIKVQRAISARDIASINIVTSNNPTPLREGAPSSSPCASTQNRNTPTTTTPQVQANPVQQQAAPPIKKPTPALINTVQMGQKFSLEASAKLSKVKACFGWNTSNAKCDVDVSAFLLNSTGKVIGEDWFVFYGQTQSPDNSTVFSIDQGADRQIISIDLTKLNTSVNKIVFVLTINEALEKNLNFSMLSDGYIRILDQATNKELVSFKMTEYYSNVTSMMIGEIYLHNGQWKFNAIGNGVARDLAGLCELYGVQVV